MDMGLIRGVISALVFALFIGIGLWSYSSKRKDDFDDAAVLPLVDDQTPAQNGSTS
ncbi:MAG: CcoQ/FixQ family Cbb3-type cytochrome c oxidase assembly chaperone [Pseudomonadota bacterium]